MQAMTPLQILDSARAGDLERLSVARESIAGAVRLLAETGDASSALELVGRTSRIWLSHGEVDEGVVWWQPRWQYLESLRSPHGRFGLSMRTACSRFAPAISNAPGRPTKRPSGSLVRQGTYRPESGRYSSRVDGGSLR